MEIWKNGFEQGSNPFVSINIVLTNILFIFTDMNSQKNDIYYEVSY